MNAYEEDKSIISLTIKRDNWIASTYSTDAVAADASLTSNHRNRLSWFRTSPTIRASESASSAAAAADTSKNSEKQNNISKKKHQQQQRHGRRIVDRKDTTFMFGKRKLTVMHFFEKKMLVFREFNVTVMCLKPDMQYGNSNIITITDEASIRVLERKFLPEKYQYGRWKHYCKYEHPTKLSTNTTSTTTNDDPFGLIYKQAYEDATNAMRNAYEHYNDNSSSNCIFEFEEDYVVKKRKRSNDYSNATAAAVVLSSHDDDFSTTKQQYKRLKRINE